MPELEPLVAVRIAAAPGALDGLDVDEGLVLRTAADEALVVGVEDVEVADEHAIVFQDTSWMGRWVGADEADQFLHRACEFDLPSQRPALVQGMVAHLAVKMWLEADRILFVVPTAVASDFTDRWERLS